MNIVDKFDINKWERKAIICRLKREHIEITEENINNYDVESLYSDSDIVKDIKL